MEYILVHGHVVYQTSLCQERFNTSGFLSKQVASDREHSLCHIEVLFISIQYFFVRYHIAVSSHDL